MRDEHIKKLLDEAPLSSLGRAELAAVRAHAETCAECGRAFEAARAASLMLKARAQEAFEPPPFFQTRVLAALRERQANAPFSFARLWKSAGALVASMAASVALLATLTFVAPQQATPETSDIATASNHYTADDVILNQADAPDDDVTYDQVLTTLYDQTDDNAR